MIAQDSTSSLSNLVNNLSEGTHRIKCKFGHDDKKCQACGIKFLEYTNFKDDLIEYKYVYYNKNYQHKFDEKLKEQCFNAYKFSNKDNNRFIILLQKGAFSYEYMVT